MKLQGRGHSPSAADVSDIWNFLKQYDVDGLISDKPKTDTKDTAAADTSKKDTTATDKKDSTKTDKDDPKAGKDDKGTTVIANNALLLNVEKTYSVYNMKGAFVGELKASRIDDVQVKLNSMRLDKGLYVVKSGNLNRVFSIK